MHLLIAACNITAVVAEPRKRDISNEIYLSIGKLN
jgi:hypothetical protein